MGFLDSRWLSSNREATPWTRPGVTRSPGRIFGCSHISGVLGELAGESPSAECRSMLAAERDVENVTPEGQQTGPDTQADRSEGPRSEEETDGVSCSQLHGARHPRPAKPSKQEQKRRSAARAYRAQSPGMRSWPE